MNKLLALLSARMKRLDASSRKMLSKLIPFAMKAMEVVVVKMALWLDFRREFWKFWLLK